MDLAPSGVSLDSLHNFPTNITPMEQACWLLRMRREDFAKMGMSSGTGTSLHRKMGFGFVCDLWTFFYQMQMHEGSSMPPLNWSP